MAGYENSLVRKAKEAGGDAIIFIDSHSELVGYYNSGETGTSITTRNAYVSGNTAYYQGQNRHQSFVSTTQAIQNKV